MKRKPLGRREKSALVRGLFSSFQPLEALNAEYEKLSMETDENMRLFKAFWLGVRWCSQVHKTHWPAPPGNREHPVWLEVRKLAKRSKSLKRAIIAEARERFANAHPGTSLPSQESMERSYARHMKRPH